MLEKLTKAFVTTEVLPGTVVEIPKENKIKRSSSSNVLRFLSYMFGPSGLSTEEEPHYHVKTEIGPNEIGMEKVPAKFYNLELETPVYLKRNCYVCGIIKGKPTLERRN
jgi:hypothetical protein